MEVPEYGRVGIRSVSQLQLSRRYSSYVDQRTGQPKIDEAAKADIHKLIDQLMENETTPMFTDKDFTEVASLDSAVLAPLYAAINQFNGDEEKNVSAESNGSPEK